MDTFNNRGGNWNMASVALTGLSGAATTLSTTGTPAYVLDGKFLASTNQSSGASPTTDIATGAAFKALANGKQCIFVFGWDSSAPTVFSVAQGPIVNTADVVAKAAALDFPSIPDTFVPVAYVSIANASATAWTFGTGLWNAASLTIGTVENVMQLPEQPATAATA